MGSCGTLCDSATPAAKVPVLHFENDLDKLGMVHEKDLDCEGHKTALWERRLRWKRD